MVSEDFAVYLHHVPGCFMFFGSGKSAVANENVSLHQNIYDYNDEILEPGTRFWAELVRQRLR